MTLVTPLWCSHVVELVTGRISCASPCRLLGSLVHRSPGSASEERESALTPTASSAFSLFFLVDTAQINIGCFLSNLWIEITSVTTRDACRAPGEQQVWKKTCLISVSPWWQGVCLQFRAVCHGFICCDGGLEMASYFVLRFLAALRLENYTFLDATWDCCMCCHSFYIIKGCWRYNRWVGKWQMAQLVVPFLPEEWWRGATRGCWEFQM